MYAFGLMVLSFVLTAQTGCDTQLAAPAKEKNASEVLRSYSPIYFYLAYREFVNLNPQLKEGAAFEAQAASYIETRLFELEPDKAGYPGILRDFTIKQQEMVAAAKLKQSLQGLSKTSFEDIPEADFPGFATTMEQELAFLKPGTPERNDLLAIEALAKQRSGLGKTFSEASYQAQTKGLKKALEATWLEDEETWTAVTQTSSTNLNIGGGWATTLAALGLYVGTVYVRAALARKYALEETSIKFNGGDNGTQGDAFRHVYLNVLLRRWVRLGWAVAITSMYETLNPNEPRHRAMDLHNNHVGHRAQYTNLNGNWFLDFFDWQQMSANCAAFIQNSSNGHYIAAWRDRNEAMYPSSHSVAESYTSNINADKYIFINP